MLYPNQCYNEVCHKSKGHVHVYITAHNVKVMQKLMMQTLSLIQFMTLKLNTFFPATRFINTTNEKHTTYLYIDVKSSSLLKI